MIMTYSNNRNSQYNHHWSVLALLLLLGLVVFKQILHVSATSATTGGATSTEFYNDDALEFESSHNDNNDDDDDMNNKQPAGVCISSSSSISSFFLSGSYKALSEQDVHDISHIGGPRAHVYGEMTPTGFRQFANYVNLTLHDVFVDLGSGVGSLVIQAAVEFGVARSIGVELSVARHAAAVQSFQKLMLQSTTTTTGDDNDDDDIVTFVQGDAASGQVVGRFLAEATVVWISNLLFDDALNRKLASVIEQYAGPNLRVIASLKPLVRPTTTTRHQQQQPQHDIIKGFELQSFKVPFEMSWTAGIHNQQEYYHQVSLNNGSQQQQQSSQSSSSSSPGHFCSILLRRQ